jgi:hypothetical protein
MNEEIIYSMLYHEGKKRIACLLAGVWKLEGIGNSIKMHLIFRQGDVINMYW